MKRRTPVLKRQPLTMPEKTDSTQISRTLIGALRERALNGLPQEFILDSSSTPLARGQALMASMMIHPSSTRVTTATAVSR